MDSLGSGGMRLLSPGMEGVVDVSYGCAYSDKDNQVKMELNMDDKTLKYYVNGEDQGIAFDNICFDNDQHYSMCISLDEPMSVQLIDFKHV